MEKTMIPVCTTMNKEIYERYGHVMVESWINHWSGDFHLYIWAEDEFSIPDSDKITIMPWGSVNARWKTFTNLVALNSDESRFTKKAFVTIESFNEFNNGFYIWLDADTETLKDVTVETFKDLLLDDYLIHLFDVSKIRDNGFVAMAAESGFVVINLNHPDWPTLKTHIETPWVTGQKPPTAEHWFDGEILRYATTLLDESVVNRLEKYAVAGKKIADKPWNYMWLSEYVIHHKGRKAKRKRFE